MNVDALSRQKINIGNYAESAKITVEAMERAREKVAAVTKQFGHRSLISHLDIQNYT